MPTRAQAAPQLRIGCSGWSYKSWRGRFYPDTVPTTQWLPYYLSQFDTVEANSTFYRLPALETFAAWAAQTPPGFVMAVKASRYLTHLKRLRDPEEPLQRLLERAAALGPRLGPVLYQLPGHFHADLDRLETFLTALPATAPRLGRRRAQRLQHVLEFRHPSWYTDETFALLARHGVALCLHDMQGSVITHAPATPFTYVRFHGATGRYFGNYDPDTLDRWAERLAADWLEGRDVYAYFNNDPDAASTRDAAALRAAIEARLAAADPATRTRRRGRA